MQPDSSILILPDESDQMLVSLIRAYVHHTSFDAWGAASLNDWKILVEKSIRHRITPVLYDIVKTIDRCPQGIAGRLKRDYLQNGVLNARRFHIFHELIADLRKQNIPVILLKGVYYADYIYKNIALRTMDDFDILIQKKYLNQILSLLFNRQYRFASQKITKHKELYFNRSYFVSPQLKHFPTLISPDGDLGLEIHCGLVPEDSSIQIDSENIWKRAVQIEDNVWRLCPEDLLNYHCYHTGITHLFRGGLRDFIDLVKVLDHDQDRIEWSAFVKTVRTCKTERCVVMILAMVQEILNVDIESEVFKALEAGAFVGRFQTEAMCLLFKDSQAVRGFSKDFIRFWARSGIVHKILMLFRILFPSKQIMALMYPVKNSTIRMLLYYPRRFIDLLRRYVAIVCKMQPANSYLMQTVHQMNQLEQWLLGSIK
ncbi:nucleotidyltransferase family protein [bacterium]|nr:nucleotidyltransferase family protein [bacterium]